MVRARNLNSAYIIILVQFIIVLVVASLFWGAPEITPDSDSYLSWSDYRSIGYPLFLELLGSVNPSLFILGPMQFLLVGLSSIFLSRQVALFLGSEIWAFFVFILICANPFTLSFVPQVMTEALYTALTTTVLALGLRFLDKPSVMRLLLIGLVIFALVAVRPIGLSFLVLVIGLPLISFRFQRSRNSALQSPIPMVASVFLAAAIIGGYFVVADREGASMSLLDRHLFAKGALVEVTSSPAAGLSELEKRIWQVSDGFSEARDLIQNAPNIAVKFFAQRHYEVYLQWKVPRTIYDETGSLTYREFGEVAASVGVQRLLSAPDQTLKLIWMHYWNLWTPFTYDVDKGVGRKYFSNVEVPIETVRTRLLAPRGAKKYAPTTVVVMKVVFVISLLMIVVSLAHFMHSGRKCQTLLLSGVLALLIHLTFLLVAVTALGIARYTFALLPVFALWAAVTFNAVQDFWGSGRIRGNK